MDDREALRAAAAYTWEWCPAGEPIPGKSYRADGWYYFDPPTRFSSEMWDHFCAILGFEDQQYILLARSEGQSASGPWKRGQFLISPEGMQNLRRHAHVEQ